MNAACGRRRAGLPLVNKRWAQALQGPSHAWRDAIIGCDFDDEEEDYFAYDHSEEDDQRKGLAIDRPTNAAVVLDWFTSRSGCAANARPV